MFKKYLILIAVLGLVLVGCGKNSSLKENESSINETTTNKNGIDLENEDIKTVTSNLKPGEEAQGNSFNFFLVGIKEYKKIKSNIYTDTPAKGKKYLVLFLAFYNKTEAPVYIPADGITAEVDGKEVENTYLVNDPEDYSPIFQNVAAGGSISGYLVWEVPSDWKEFTFTYSGLDWACKDVITSTITPDMVYEPEEVIFEKQ